MQDSFENFRKLSDHFDGVTSNTAAVLQETLKEVAQSWLAQSWLKENQRVKQVTILSIEQLQESFLIVRYELVLSELCINSCQGQIDSTTMYNDVTSYISTEISNGGFTLSLQANAVECGDDCNEIQNAEVVGGTFEDEEVVVSTSEPSPNPTPKPSKRPKSRKRSKGRKSGKPTTQNPTPKPSQEPTPKPTREPTSKPSRKPRKKSKKAKKKNRCGGTLCDEKTISELAPNFTPLDATKLPSAADLRHTEYQPLRSRIPKVNEHQIDTYEVEQVDEKEEIAPLIPASLPPDFPTGSPIDSLTFYPNSDEELTSHQMRTRGHMSDATPLDATKFPSASDQQYTKYQPLRKRKIEIHEVEQASSEIPVYSPNLRMVGFIDSPSFKPTFDEESTSNKKRVREHMSGATPIDATKLLSTPDHRHTEYQPLRKRISQITEERKIDIYKVDQVEKEEEKSSLVPVSPPDSLTGRPIDSPTFNPTFDEELTSNKKRVREHTPGATPLDATKLLSTADQRHTEYQPLRKRIPRILEERKIEIYEVGQGGIEENKPSSMPVSPPEFLTGRPIDSPTFYPTLQDKERQ